MQDNSTLSDYLAVLKREGAPRHLAIFAWTGGAVAILGLILGLRFAPLSGLGLATLGLSAWARLQQLADAAASHPEHAHDGRTRGYRLLATAALVLAAAGTLVAFFAAAFALVLGRFW
jgi:hypothetical protein